MVSAMLFNAIFNNISAYIVAVSFIDGGNQRTWRKNYFILGFAIIWISLDKFSVY
jgi:hypothetical protein